MRITFNCKTNKDYVAINAVKFVLPIGMTITIDRTNTEWDIEGSNLSMTWHGCYLWAINGNNIFTDETYITDSSGFEDLVADSKVVFELEDDIEDRDYEVICLNYTIGE